MCHNPEAQSNFNLEEESNMSLWNVGIRILDYVVTIQKHNPEEGSMFLRNIDWLSTNYMTLYRRRQKGGSPRRDTESEAPLTPAAAATNRQQKCVQQQLCLLQLSACSSLSLSLGTVCCKQNTTSINKVRKRRLLKSWIKSPPPVHILSQINLIHTTPSYLSKILFNIVHWLKPWSSSGLFPSGFPTNILYNKAKMKFSLYLIN
jgi:hypothetical protein